MWKKNRPSSEPSGARELWDEDVIDLVGSAFIELQPGGQGTSRFIAAEGWMGVREAERDGRPGIEFSWEGHDECDPASGAVWHLIYFYPKAMRS